jgi:hypothetical protein
MTFTADGRSTRRRRAARWRSARASGGSACALLLARDRFGQRRADGVASLESAPRTSRPRCFFVLACGRWTCCRRHARAAGWRPRLTLLLKCTFVSGRGMARSLPHAELSPAPILWRTFVASSAARRSGSGIALPVPSPQAPVPNLITGVSERMPAGETPSDVDDTQTGARREEAPHSRRRDATLRIGRPVAIVVGRHRDITGAPMGRRRTGEVCARQQQEPHTGGGAIDGQVGPAIAVESPGTVMSSGSPSLVRRGCRSAHRREDAPHAGGGAVDGEVREAVAIVVARHREVVRESPLSRPYRSGVLDVRRLPHAGGGA